MPVRCTGVFRERERSSDISDVEFFADETYHVVDVVDELELLVFEDDAEMLFELDGKLDHVDRVEAEVEAEVGVDGEVFDVVAEETVDDVEYLLTDLLTGELTSIGLDCGCCGCRWVVCHSIRI